MSTIVVLYPITVPAGKFCWDHRPLSDDQTREVCEHFSNEGGHATCDFGFDPIENTGEGYLKPEMCCKLREENDKEKMARRNKEGG